MLRDHRMRDRRVEMHLVPRYAHWRSAPALMLMLILVVVLNASASWAQAVRGTVLGKVMDQAGLPIAGAKVTAVEMNTNIASTALSNESGDYTMNVNDGV